MKEKLLILTKKLYSAGFDISAIEVEASDMVRIKFIGFNGLEIILNESYAKIEDGDCSNEKLRELKELIETHYTLKDEISSKDGDIFNQLLNAN